MPKRSRAGPDAPFDDISSSTGAGSNGGKPSFRAPKYKKLDTSAFQPEAIRCWLPPHKFITFANQADYDKHYAAEHTNRCVECNANFPTAHFLDLHIGESHDPFRTARRERGEKTYACFVEGCEKICGDWTRRRSHLVDKHGYPKNYDFLIVGQGLKGRSSMLRAGIDPHGHRKSSRERRSSASTEATAATPATDASGSAEATESSEALGSSKAIESSEAVESSEAIGSSGPIDNSEAVESSEAVGSSEALEISQEPISVPEAEARGQSDRKRVNQPPTPEIHTLIDDLAQSIDSLKLVPRSITFGGRKGKAGFARSRAQPADDFTA